MEHRENLLIRVLKKTDKAFDRLSKVCVCFCGVIVVCTTLMLFAGVLNRTFSNWVWLFVEEWGALSLIPMSYLAFGYTLRQGRHLKMDLAVQRLPDKWKIIFAIFSAAFSLVCLVFMIRFASNWLKYIVVRGVVSSGPMQTPLTLFSAFVLIGLCLFIVDMMFFLIFKILDLRGERGELCKQKQ